MARVPSSSTKDDDDQGDDENVRSIFQMEMFNGDGQWTYCMESLERDDQWRSAMEVINGVFHLDVQ